MKAQSNWQRPYRFGMFVIWPQGKASTIGNKLRELHDPTSQRVCEAHITLSQPLLALPDHQAWQTIEAIAQDTPSFPVQVGPIEVFADSTVVKFAIEPQQTIVALRNRLHDTGLFNLSLPFTQGFIPHMTIGEFGLQDPQQAKTLARALNKTIEHTHFQCSAITYIRPDADFRYDAVRSVSLGFVASRPIER